MPDYYLTTPKAWWDTNVAPLADGAKVAIGNGVELHRADDPLPDDILTALGQFEVLRMSDPADYTAAPPFVDATQIGTTTAFAGSSGSVTINAGAEAATREIWLCLAGRFTASFNPAEWEVACGGVTSTSPVINRSADNQSVIIVWRLSVPTGAPTTITLTRLSGTVTVQSGAIMALRTTGSPTLQTFVDAHDTTLGTLGAGETPNGCENPAYQLNTSLTVNAGSAVIGIGAATHQGSGVTWTGLTQQVFGGSGITGGGFHALATNVSAGTRNVSLALAGQSAGNNARLLAVELRA